MKKCYMCKSKIPESPYRNLVPVEKIDNYRQVCNDCMLWYESNTIPNRGKRERVEKYFVRERETEVSA